jgi:hypothetical protein
MTTHKIEVAHEPLVKQKFNWLLAIGIFIVGLGLGAFATTLPIAKIELGEQNAVGPIVRDFPAHPDLAEPEMGATEVEAARSNDLVDFYRVKDGPGALAWPPRPMQFHIAEKAGVRLDENALAEYHQSEWGRIPNGVLRAENALAKYHQSERELVPMVTLHPIDENALDAYHQSEWGLTPSAVLPIEEGALAKHDREYGLAAFSTVPTEVKEADAPRAIAEPGLARYHESEWGFVPNKANADRDIGLMEFFATPNETSRQHTEPGTLEALPNIDPADRKFFSPGYGAISNGSKEVEVLPTIDPADRKFFNPGYGAQMTSTKQSEAILLTIESEFGKQIPIWFLLK